MTITSTLGLVPLDPASARTLQRLSARAQEALLKRDTAIMDARRAGASLREIEAATGINHVTVKRLIERYKAAGDAHNRVSREPGPGQERLPDGTIRNVLGGS